MKNYLRNIKITQNILVAFGILILLFLPVILAFFGDYVPYEAFDYLYGTSLFAVFLVMIIRPLADLLPNIPWIRPLVILRKGVGILSASIIVGILFSNILIDAHLYLSNFFSLNHWSFTNGAILSPLSDVSALILLITSNVFSKRVLGANWKRIQKLSYVYFCSGALYEYLLLDKDIALVAMIVVTVLVVAAYIKNRLKPVVSRPV